MNGLCAVRDRVAAATSGWDWKWILLYLAIIALFIYVAHETYYKYILPRLNPNFVPNKEFINKNKDMELPFPFPGAPDDPDDPDNPDDQGEPAELLFFCVKWCPHCKKADPEWNKIVKKFEGQKINKSTIFFKKIDCEDDEALADRYKIEGYPTIKLEKGDQIIEYNAKPNAETLEEFLREQL